MARVFVSYSHEDKGFAERLRQDLQRSGHDVWIDAAEIRIGESLLEKISTAIHAVDYVLALISRASVRSGWVQHELNTAMEREIQGRQLIVLPALLEDVELPNYLRGKVYADFREVSSYRHNLNKIVEALGHEKASRTQERATPPTAPSPGSKSPSRVESGVVVFYGRAEASLLASLDLPAD